MRAGRRGRWRSGGRRTATVMVIVLALSLAAPPQALTAPGVDPLPLSWLWSWWGLPAGGASPPVPPTPHQEAAGGAGGRSHSAAPGSTQAHPGAGQAPGKGAGPVGPEAPHQGA